MKPVAFDGCLGWLHEGRSEYGVVICEPLGHEALWTHKLMRALAERLARAGVWVLRFNYPSAGDSAGDDTDAARFDRSLSSVHRAIALLRELSGISDLTMIGIRAGAMFAMLAASGKGAATTPQINAMALLAPVVRGRSYTRELSMLQQGWLDTAPPAIRAGHADEPCMNVFGHRYPADLIEQMRPVNLCKVASELDRSLQSMLLIDTDYGDSPQLRTALLSRGIAVDIDGFPEWAGTMKDSVYSRLPERALDSLIEWTLKRTRIQKREDTRHMCSSVLKTTESASIALTSNGTNEYLIRMHDGTLTGVLCMSDRPGATTVLIANTASNPRIADGRFAVCLARELARHGVNSLRIDVSGVGDGGTEAPDDQSRVPYADQTVQDVVAAANWLSMQGHRDIVAFGICSGAYAAMHAAIQSASLKAIIAVNLPRFTWPAGMTLIDALKERPNSARGYLTSARDLKRWKRALRERRDPLPIMRAMIRRALSPLVLPAKRLAERLGWKPAPGTSRAVMYQLRKKNVKTLLIYGEYDPGLDALHRHFGTVRRAFKSWKNAQVRTVHYLDHAVFGTAGRNAVIDLCVQEVAKRSASQARERAASGACFAGTPREANG